MPPRNCRPRRTSALHRHGRRPRRLLRRQGDGRAAGLAASWPAGAIWSLRRCCSSSTWTWRPRPGRRPGWSIARNLRGVPHHGIGRGFKAGKEEIVGLLTALDRFVKADDAADNEAPRSPTEGDRRVLDGIDVTLVPAPSHRPCSRAGDRRPRCTRPERPPAARRPCRASVGASRRTWCADARPAGLLPEHDAPLAAAIRAQFKSAD